MSTHTAPREACGDTILHEGVVLVHGIQPSELPDIHEGGGMHEPHLRAKAHCHGAGLWVNFDSKSRDRLDDIVCARCAAFQLCVWFVSVCLHGSRRVLCCGLCGRVSVRMCVSLRCWLLGWWDVLCSRLSVCCFRVSTRLSACVFGSCLRACVCVFECLLTLSVCVCMRVCAGLLVLFCVCWQNM